MKKKKERAEHPWLASEAEISAAKSFRLKSVKQAFFAAGVADATSKASEYDRIYIGCEFDEANLPSAGDVVKVVEACQIFRSDLTLVTPVSTDSGIRRIRKLLETLRGYPGTEVVANDFGVLLMLKGFPELNPVAGRLLVRQKSDPRLAAVKSERARNIFRKTALDNKESAALLKEYGVGRVELDNPAAGIELPGGFAVSVYYPFVFLTMSMDGYGDMGSKHEGCFVLRNGSMPADILLKGNAQFYRNTSLEGLRSRKIDRIVIQGRLPG